MTELDITIAIATVFSLLAAEPIVLGILRLLGCYTIVREREARVYILFGDIVGVLTEPGIYFLWGTFGWRALLVNWLGTCYQRDTGIDQNYLRSIPVNSEEGTPMGIGVWYEMYITDPVAHIFRNEDPVGSLSAHVRNATIKRLSNLPMTELLSNRHTMSHIVSTEVTPESSAWGYSLGSVYIRKVHFRDEQMIHQIEEKVVNRLRQVTSAIRQDGVNQVNVIGSKAEREASVEFARAAMVRPQIVGTALETIGGDADVLVTLFDILELERLLASPGELTLLPSGAQGELLAVLLAARAQPSGSTSAAARRTPAKVART